MKKNSQKFWNADAAQSLVRAIVKILGGFMVAKGVADQSSVEVISAGAVTLAAVVWGLCHRSGNRKPIDLSELPLLLFFVFLLAGCASLNTRAFQAERAATDAAYSALADWKQFHAAALTSTPAPDQAKLTQQQNQVYAASRAFASSAAVATNLRHVCTTNATPQNRLALDASLNAMQARSSNMVWLVRSFTVAQTP